LPGYTLLAPIAIPAFRTGFVKMTVAASLALCTGLGNTSLGRDIGKRVIGTSSALSSTAAAGGELTLPTPHANFARRLRHLVLVMVLRAGLA